MASPLSSILRTRFSFAVAYSTNKVRPFPPFISTPKTLIRIPSIKSLSTSAISDDFQKSNPHPSSPSFNFNQNPINQWVPRHNDSGNPNGNVNNNFRNQGFDGGYDDNRGVNQGFNQGNVNSDLGAPLHGIANPSPNFQNQGFPQNQNYPQPGFQNQGYPQKPNQGRNYPGDGVNQNPNFHPITQQQNQNQWGSNVASESVELLSLCREGKVREVLEQLDNGVLASPECFSLLFRLCGNSKKLEEAKKVHGYFLRSPFRGDLQLVNQVIDMYSKCRSMMKQTRVVGSRRMRTTGPGEGDLKQQSKAQAQQQRRAKMDEKQQPPPPPQSSLPPPSATACRFESLLEVYRGSADRSFPPESRQPVGGAIY